MPSQDVMPNGGRLGEYELISKLGQGGMGAVYKARHGRLKRLVAVKVLAAHLQGAPEILARFVREMEAIARLDHPNLIRAYDASEVNGIHFLVMEYLEGRDLAEELRERGRFAPQEACRIIIEAARGLQHVYDNNLVHRDIKPSNLFLSRKADRHETTVKILDLGIARFLDVLHTSDLTSTGRGIGTPDYMAPEQCKGSKDVDGRADIYSLGCTMYHLISGRPPFPADSLQGKMAGHLFLEPDRIETLVEDLPTGLGEVIAKMMAKQANERFASPDGVVQALEPFVRPSASGSSPRIEQGSVPETVNPPPPESIIPPDTRPDFDPDDYGLAMVPPETKIEFIPADSSFSGPSLPKTSSRPSLWLVWPWHVAFLVVLVAWWEFEKPMRGYWFYFRWAEIYLGFVLASLLSRRVDQVSFTWAYTVVFVTIPHEVMWFLKRGSIDYNNFFSSDWSSYTVQNFLDALVLVPLIFIIVFLAGLITAALTRETPSPEQDPVRSIFEHKATKSLILLGGVLVVHFLGRIQVIFGELAGPYRLILFGFLLLHFCPLLADRFIDRSEISVQDRSFVRGFLSTVIGSVLGFAFSPVMAAIFIPTLPGSERPDWFVWLFEATMIGAVAGLVGAVVTKEYRVPNG